MLQVKRCESNLTISQEFKSLITSLSYSEFGQLTNSIKENGCISPIIVWGSQNTIVDGHNRYEICTKLNIHYDVSNLEFNSESEAKIWIIKNQFGRRNLSNYEKSILALKMNDIIEEEALKKRDSCLKQNVETDNQISDRMKVKIEINTNKTLSRIAGVSHDTIARVKKIEQCADKETKKLLLSEKKSINQVYNEIKQKEIKEAKEKLRKEKFEKNLPSIIETKELFNAIYINVYFREIERYYKRLILPAQDNCVLFIWANSNSIEIELEYVNKWGFDLQFALIWDKNDSLHHFEILLVCLKGSYDFNICKSIPLLVYQETPIESLSRPKYYNEVIEKIIPDTKYLEISEHKNYNENWISMKYVN